MVKNLWGDLPKPDTIRLPAVMLQEQADLITEMTGGVIRGKVDTGKDSDGDLYAQLILQVPLLSNYQYYLVHTYSKGIRIYPAFLGLVEAPEPHTEVAGPKEFEATLENLLSSKFTKEVVGSLLAQATSLSVRSTEKKK